MSDASAVLSSSLWKKSDAWTKKDALDVIRDRNLAKVEADLKEWRNRSRAMEKSWARRKRIAARKALAAITPLVKRPGAGFATRRDLIHTLRESTKAWRSSQKTILQSKVHQKFPPAANHETPDTQ